jgi:hypothetical protein
MMLSRSSKASWVFPRGNTQLSQSGVCRTAPNGSVADRVSDYSAQRESRRVIGHRSRKQSLLPHTSARRW